MSFIDKVKKFFHVYFYFFTPREKKRFILLLFIVACMALLDVSGIASLLPFLQLIANPQSIHENKLLNYIWQLMNQPSQKRFLLYSGLLVFVVLVVGSIFKSFGSYVILRFSNLLRYYIGGRLFQGYLNQEYKFFLNRNSSELLNNVINEVDQIVGMLYLPSMSLISNGVLALAILAALIIFDWFLALATGIVLGGSFWGIYLFSRQKVKLLGKERMLSNELRVKVVNEALGGIKDLKLKNHENIFFSLFEKETSRFANSLALSQMYSYLPKFILEAISFGGILLIVLYYIMSQESIHSILPTIGFIAFAGYKLMPSLQQILNAITNIRFMFSGIHSLYIDYSLTKSSTLGSTSIDIPASIKFNKKIQLKNINVRYPNTDKDVLQEINMVFLKNKITGIVGKSGAGKTTLVDVVLGLLPVREGKILVDDIPLNQNLIKSWQKMLGYVPQNIYLMDNTIAANIAFTLHHEDADLALVEQAAKAAQIHDFIVNELPEGYKTIVGERGIRFSGGQRQRIAIARALYSNPEILVLDEATSALDGVTEEAVLQAITGLRGDKTIIIITHKNSTLKICDKIYRLEKGRLVK